MLSIWVGVVFGARYYPSCKTLKRGRVAKYNHYHHAVL